MTAKQFQTLVGESISDTDIKDATAKVNEASTKLAQIETEIEDWEKTHDMAAPGSLKRRHEAAKHDRAKAQKALNALQASAKTGFVRR